MHRKVIINIVFVLLLSCNALFAAGLQVNLGPETNIKQYVIEPSGAERGSGQIFGPFVYSMAFCERICVGLGISKYFTFDELVKMGDEIYRYLQKGQNVTLIIRDYKKGQDLTLGFYYKSPPKRGLHLVFLSNYVEAEDVLLEPGMDQTHAWAMLYKVTGGELVDYKYSIGKEKKPDANEPGALGNYYLQDEDPGNDKYIEKLMQKSIAKGGEGKAMDYTILAQYYILAGRYQAAGLALNKVLTSPQSNKGLENKEFYYITSMELELVKRCREQRP